MSYIVHTTFDHRLLLLAAIVILLAGLMTLVVRWPLGVKKTFSQHAAVRLSLRIYYSVIFGITLPLLLVFFVGWFVPVLRLPVRFPCLSSYRAYFNFCVR